jgi:hypothetical protein
MSGSPTAGFSELLCLLPNEPQENHNFKTDFIWESQNYFGSSLEGEKKTTNPFPAPSPGQKAKLQHKPYWSQFPVTERHLKS